MEVAANHSSRNSLPFAAFAGLIPALFWSFGRSPGWAMVLSLVLFFHSLKGVMPRQAIPLGFIYGLILHGVSLSWLWNVFPGFCIALWCILSIFPALFAGLFAATTAKCSNLALKLLWIPALWTAIEYFRSEWFVLRFSWITPGTAMGPLWLHSILGVYGVTFFAVLLSGCLAFALSKRLIWWISPLLILLLAIRPPTPADEASRRIPVCAIQKETLDFHSYLEETTRQNFREGVVLWPECSSPWEPEIAASHRLSRLSMSQKLQELAAKQNLTLVLGAIIPSGKPTPWNEAKVYDSTGEIGAHRKNRPVHFMHDGIPGETQQPITTRWGKIGTPICFDNDYSEIPLQFARHGATVFFAPSLDAIAWGKRQHLQHAELFRLRAVETGRWYVVCASSGQTQSIRPDGVVTASLPLIEEGILMTEVFTRENLTPYVAGGWTFPWIICAIALLGLLGFAISFLREHFRRKPPAAPSTVQ